MKIICLGLIIILCVFVAFHGQNKVAPQANSSALSQRDSSPVGGGCDGCELMYVDMPASMSPIDTSPGWEEAGQKLLLRGQIFKRNGKTPAGDVILYYWQTDAEGYYSPRPGMTPAARRHGHIRGWVKTDAQGRYTIYTIRPAPYPNEDMPAHIHTSIKEPGIANEYYVDEFVFDDDPLLTPAKRKMHENRGGSGILRPRLEKGLWLADHQMTLGLNIPGYPATE